MLRTGEKGSDYNMMFLEYPSENTRVVAFGQLSSKQLNSKACKHQHQCEEQNGNLIKNQSEIHDRYDILQINKGNNLTTLLNAQDTLKLKLKIAVFVLEDLLRKFP